MEAAERAGNIRSFCRGQFPHALRQMRIFQRDLGEARTRSAAGVHSAARIGADRAATREKVSAGDPFAARAQLPQFQLRQPAFLREGIPARNQAGLSASAMSGNIRSARSNAATA